ncbi:MAG: hypothetical protein K2J12_02630 [Muribaculaceae bacterium]|nr:hypothetical protein [Muribaculaceae bacterium]
MTPLYTSAWAWASWIIIGIVAGFMASYFLPGKRNVFLDVIIGLVGGIIGGWGSALAIGDHTPQSFAIAALVALFIAGAALWLYNTLLTRMSNKK